MRNSDRWPKRSLGILAESTTGKKSQLYWFLFLLISAALVNSFLIDKHFSADGVYYFFQILQKRTFVHHDWARQYSLYLTQWPVVLALQLGVKDVIALNRLFALGIYSVYLISFLLCDIALCEDDKTMLIWPLLSMVALNFSTDYHLSGEYPVVMLLAWPILFYLIRNRLTTADRVILLLLMVLYSRIYQSAMAASVVFGGLLVYQNLFRKPGRPAVELYILLLLSALIFAIAWYTTIHPFSDANKTAFLDNLPLVLHNEPLCISMVFMVLFAFGSAFRKPWIYAASMLPLLFYLGTLFISAQGVPARISFASRSVSTFILPLFMLTALFLHYRGFRFDRIPLLIISLFIALMVAGNIRYSVDWLQYKEEYVAVLNSHSGFVPVEKTCLMKNPCQWGWTNPFLSLAWSDGCVHSIVMNQPSKNGFFKTPFRHLKWTNYLCYSKVFLAVDSTVRICP